MGYKLVTPEKELIKHQNVKLTKTTAVWLGALWAFGVRLFDILVLYEFFFRGYQFVVYISTYKRCIESFCCL